MSRGLSSLAWILAFAVASAGRPAVASPAAVAEFRAFTRDLSALSGRFTQEVRDKNGRVARTSVGSFAIARPGRFRFDYEKPFRQTIVSDGTTVWIHDEDLNQVTIRKLGDTLSEQPLALLLEPARAEQLFEFKAGPPAGSVGLVLVEPRKKEAAFSDLVVAMVGREPRELSWRDALLNQNTLRFESVSKNPRLAPELFSFTPPKGADVLRQ
ncbi:MAG: outer membrane lipoprotein carrier protein LolA [Casimicrobiaceae bacterium]|nr:outer membrane lipoprotein carrier protein LolA [Casimicrobiaceae bacterium]MCX8098390.1 outer membrane lipoprotein carrier protein LolA [Casimicrobiaceae bacterium]MDW8312546.1 outer membrane lipoprotein carrier protein LolA [Burkholderiales bacterium]